MAEETKKKIKIGYALRAVSYTDEQGNKKIRYEKYHPITTGNAVVVGGKTLKNKFSEYQTKIDEEHKIDASCVNDVLVKTEQTLSDEEKAQVRANIGAISASEVDSCFVIEDGLVCQTFNE